MLMNMNYGWKQAADALLPVLFFVLALLWLTAGSIKLVQAFLSGNIFDIPTIALPVLLITLGVGTIKHIIEDMVE